MARYLAIAAVVFGVVAGIYFLVARNRVVEFSGLTFERDGKVVRYSFAVQNVTDRSVKFRVILVANDLGAQLTRFSIGYRSVGTNREDILLGPRESRALSGSFELPVVPQGTLRLTPVFEELPSNQSSYPTPASGTSRAGHEPCHCRCG